MRVSGRQARIVVPAVAAALGAVAGATAAPPPARAASEQWFYGHTSRREVVSIDLLGGATAGSSRTPAPRNWQPRQFVMSRDGIESPLPGGQRFRRGRIAYRRTFRSGPIRTDVRLAARLQAGGRRISGTYRNLTRSPGYRPHRISVRFRTALWASSSGAAWTGTTADHRPFGLAVVSERKPGRWLRDAPRLAVRIPAVARTLRCRVGGGAFDTTATVRNLTAPLMGTPPVGGGYMFTRGLDTAAGRPARGSARTAQGVTASAETSVTRLRWRGNGLAATGRLILTGTIAGGSCDAISTTYTIHPR